MSVVKVAVDDGIAVVTVNRPDKLDVIDPEMMVRRTDAWTLVREDDAVRVAVLTGAGAGAFCAGGDLRTLIPLLTRARPAADEWEERLLRDQRSVVNTAMLRVSNFPKPVIAAVTGVCLAGGRKLMLASDLRVAADTTEFALTEVQRGLIPGRRFRRVACSRTPERGAAKGARLGSAPRRRRAAGGARGEDGGSGQPRATAGESARAGERRRRPHHALGGRKGGCPRLRRTARAEVHGKVT